MNIQETRQNTKDGSSLELVIRMPDNEPYPTASNLALWPEADPALVQKVAKHFGLDLDQVLTLEQLNEKKLSLGFVFPLTVRKLLEKHIDLQHRITKGVMKKLAKFSGKGQQYFLDNSNIKTTDEFKRITEK